MFSIDFIIEYYNASLSSLSSLPLHPVRPDHIAPGCSSHRFAIRQENGRTLSRIVLDAVFPGFLLETELCIDVFLPKEYDMERKRERNPIKMKHPNNMNKKAIFSVVVLGAVITSLVSSVMSAALPALMKEFHIPASQAQWVTSLYALVSAS